MDLWQLNGWHKKQPTQTGSVRSTQLKEKENKADDGHFRRFSSFQFVTILSKMTTGEWWKLIRAEWINKDLLNVSPDPLVPAMMKIN